MLILKLRIATFALVALSRHDAPAAPIASQRPAAGAQVRFVQADPPPQPVVEILPPVDAAPLRHFAQPNTLPNNLPNTLPGAQPQAGATAAKMFALADLENMALGNHPSLMQSAARVEAARGRWVQVGLAPNPVIGYSGEEIGNENSAGLQSGFASQEFVTGGKLQLNRAVAGREIAQLQRQFEAQRYRVINEVRIQFYETLTAQRTAEIADELFKVGDRQVRTTQDLLNAKEVSRVDLLQAGVEAETARIALHNARNRHVAAWRRLAAAAGMPTMQIAPLTGDLSGDIPQLTFDDAMGRLLAESPELSAARASVEKARWSIRRAEAEAVPNINFRAGAGHDNATGDDYGNVEASLAIPWHNRNQGGIREAQANVTIARAEVNRLELELHNRLAAAFERYANARYQVDRYQRFILPQAKESLDLTSNAYRQGEYGFLPLLTAQRTYFQTNLAFLSALGELRQSSILIEGLLLSDGTKSAPSEIGGGARMAD